DDARGSRSNSAAVSLYFSLSLFFALSHSGDPVRARLKSHLSRARKGRRASMPIEPPGRPWCGLCPRGSSAGALLEQLRGDLLGEVRAEVGRQLQGEGLARLRREVAE
ncbi:unnamed protein product, partial [Prorocentrum cordatum]